MFGSKDPTAAAEALEKASEKTQSMSWIGAIVIGIVCFVITFAAGLAALKNVKKKEEAQKYGMAGFATCIIGVIAIIAGYFMKPKA